MTKVNDIYLSLCRIAPPELQMDFDNSGFLLGHGDAAVDTVLLALDVTDAVIAEAIERRAQLIVSHHPLIFHPVRSITDADAAGKRLLCLAEKRIAVISMHTNLDIAAGGVNDVLLERFGLKAIQALDEDGCGRIGELEAALSLQDFLQRCKSALGCEGLRYADADRPVRRLALMGGSGADSIERAAALGCDTFVTADIKYHQFQKALDLGLNLIDADHFYTENPVIPRLAQLLALEFPAVRFLVSSAHRAIVSFA